LAVIGASYTPIYRNVPTCQSIFLAFAGIAWSGTEFGSDVRGKAVLVCTGWDALWRTDRFFKVKNMGTFPVRTFALVKKRG
jgi:hypothetical protein